MKKMILVMMLSVMLFGCSLNTSNESEPSKPSDTMDNIVEDVEQGSEDVGHALEDMLNDFKNQGVTLDHQEKIEHTGLNAYEAYHIQSNGHPAYLYRLNTSDAQMQKLIDHVKQTGTAEVMIEDEKKQYEAVVNGNALLLYDQNSDMKQLRKAFEAFKHDTTYPNDEMNR